jgi:hypothetical protein
MAETLLNKSGIITRLWVEPGVAFLGGTVLLSFKYLHLYQQQKNRRPVSLRDAFAFVSYMARGRLPLPCSQTFSHPDYTVGSGLNNSEPQKLTIS